jgi:NAD(P)-dependent dehydrogenase (short-subunit alcohol dehydrogenase family)
VETARSLAAHGAQVVGAARDLTKAEAATTEVRKAAGANGGSFDLIELDLASLKSVRPCADKLLTRKEPFDVVIGNAGVMATPFSLTIDGFETQFGTNHLGHFVFVNWIAPLIRAGGRLINLSSAGHRPSNVDLDDPNFERTKYEPFVAYGVRVVAGELRKSGVVVGTHVVVSAGAVPRFLARFAEVHGTLNKTHSILAAAMGHHRLLWIHAFLDGNGRVARLMSHAMLLDSLGGTSAALPKKVTREYVFLGCGKSSGTAARYGYRAGCRS